MTSTSLPIHDINAPERKGEFTMPAKAILAEGKYWYVAINHAGMSKKLTSWRNQKFSDEIAKFLEGVINNQILTGHFRWDAWFPKLGKKYLWKEVYWAWDESRQFAPATKKNHYYKAQHFKDIEKRDIRELQQPDFFWIRNRFGDTEKARAIAKTAQAALNWAYRNGLIERQVFLPTITPPKHKTPYLPLETKQAIYTEMQDPYRNPALMGVELGMRIGEICALQWQDIDWEEDGISVCHTMSAYKLKEGRKEGDEIWIPMSPKVKEMLSGLRTERPAISGFVFTHASGKQIWTQQLSSEFKRACRIVGVPNSTFHHLRNSFLHDLSEAGATTREAGALATKAREVRNCISADGARKK